MQVRISIGIAFKSKIIPSLNGYPILLTAILETRNMIAWHFMAAPKGVFIFVMRVIIETCATEELFLLGARQIPKMTGNSDAYLLRHSVFGVVQLDTLCLGRRSVVSGLMMDAIFGIFCKVLKLSRLLSRNSLTLRQHCESEQRRVSSVLKKQGKNN